ncbi:Murein L,D-transpeptidase YcbB/YkuD [Paracoccus alcaliphilus]|uniref:Murein L,D-transpeptidase YcbB/YkuD n=1 Tax=Paracoccus alcaliphilus TaxID=34002 RepID=A0A1H8ILL9_9RHOB|nr:L,D-transpeptidase family protein [Paracoccus alcaliphilus]SEN69291.1 Murein L,D-transpeptidase YcbB/YkuD [Paracoccus alcaliphilus]
MIGGKKMAAFLALMVLMAGQSVVAQPAAPQAGLAPLHAAIAPRLEFSADEMALARAAAANPVVAAFYGANGLQPVFDGPEGQIRREAVQRAVSDSGSHGIPVSRYRPDLLAGAGQDLAAEIAHAEALARYLSDLTGGMIRPGRVSAQIHRQVNRPAVDRLMAEFIASDDPAGFLESVAPQHPAYEVLRRALAERPALTAPPDLPKAPEAVWRVGMRGEGVVPLRRRLAAIGFGAAGPADLYDATLAAEVMRYQQAIGLPADGIAGPRTIRALNAGLDEGSRRIIMSLERMRWLAGEDLQARHVWVNIPEFTARIFDQGQQVFQTRTVVGTTDADRQTPEFSDQMEYVVVNPRWNVPRSITVRDYLPQLKANRHAVSHIDVVDGAGRVIPRGQIDFSRYTAANFPFRMQQKPGDNNALGLVKFIFPNPWNIYLHDTPTKHLFGNRSRAYSNGCIRIGDPFDLAHVLLSQQTDDPQAMFRRALEGGRERWLALTPNVPVHLVYFTAFPDADGRVAFHDDIYGRDEALWPLIEQAGLDSRARSD